MTEGLRLQTWVDLQCLPPNPTWRQLLCYKMTRACKSRPVVVWSTSYIDALLRQFTDEWDQGQWCILVYTDEDYRVMQNALRRELAPNNGDLIIIVHMGLD